MGSESHLLRRGLWVICGLLVLAVLAFLFLALRVGSVEPAGRPPIMVAAVGLIGIIFTGCVTALGVLLKDSLDQRAQIVAREAEARLKANAQEAEARLRAETSLRAIELMTARDLAPAVAAERREGALIALSSLGYHRFNLRLCQRFWKEKSLSPDLVMTVIDDCLRAADSHLQLAASSLLRENAKRLAVAPGDFIFPPTYFTTWKPGLSSSAKNLVLRALVSGMLSKKFDYWAENVPNQFAYTLFKMLTLDDDEMFRRTAAMYAIQLYQFLAARGRIPNFIPPDRDRITYADIRAAALAVLGLQSVGYVDEPLLLAALHRGAAQTDFDLSKKIYEWHEPRKRPHATAARPSPPAPAAGKRPGGAARAP